MGNEPVEVHFVNHAEVGGGVVVERLESLKEIAVEVVFARIDDELSVLVLRKQREPVVKPDVVKQIQTEVGVADFKKVEHDAVFGILPVGLLREWLER